MNVTRHPAASLATEYFDTETQELLDAIEMDLPDFGDIDLDIAFGTPLDLYEAGELEHERWVGENMAVTLDALRSRYGRMDAARHILADDPSITSRVRERLVDVLLPHAAQLRLTPPAAVTESVSLAA